MKPAAPLPALSMVLPVKPTILLMLLPVLSIIVSMFRLPASTALAMLISGSLRGGSLIKNGAASPMEMTTKRKMAKSVIFMISVEQG